MALRLNVGVISGWIDNTTPGMTYGGIEIVGMDRPLELRLKGDCCRDLAGTRLDFVNPNPMIQEDVIDSLQALQRGIVGDMTASERVKSILVSQLEMVEYLEAGEEVPFDWSNCVYLEWYSLTNGRIVIESTDFELKITSHSWELDEEGERQRKELNADALVHFMELVTHANVAESQLETHFENEADEFEWERRLKVRDSLEETMEFLSQGKKDGANDLLDPDLVSNRDVVVRKAHELQMDVMLYLGNSFLDSGSRGDLASTIQFVYETLNEVYPEHTKLDNMEKGYKIAMLKRSADASNIAISACNTLEMEDDGFEVIRTDIFTLRDMILDNVRELRGEINSESQ